MSWPTYHIYAIECVNSYFTQKAVLLSVLTTNGKMNAIVLGGGGQSGIDYKCPSQFIASHLCDGSFIVKFFSWVRMVVNKEKLFETLCYWFY